MARRAAALVALAAAAALAGGCGSPVARRVTLAPPPTAVGDPTTAAPATTTTTVPVDPYATFVVATKGAVLRYPAPGQPSDGIIPSTWYGYPTVLPVIAQRPGWLQVRLAQRPNGSVAWIHQSDAILAAITTYRIVVSLAAQRLRVFDEGKLLRDFPAGVGTADDPTVTGHFFIAIKSPPNGPGYGPFVLALSAHSDRITDWEGLGDAIIAIHGPIDAYADARIGTTGAHISHGCIRLHVSDLAQLDAIPVGTPVDIVA